MTSTEKTDADRVQPPRFVGLEQIATMLCRPMTECRRLAEEGSLPSVEFSYGPKVHGTRRRIRLFGPAQIGAAQRSLPTPEPLSDRRPADALADLATAASGHVVHALWRPAAEEDVFDALMVEIPYLRPIWSARPSLIMVLCSVRVPKSVRRALVAGLALSEDLVRRRLEAIMSDIDDIAKGVVQKLDVALASLDERIVEAFGSRDVAERLSRSIGNDIHRLVLPLQTFSTDAIDDVLGEWTKDILKSLATARSAEIRRVDFASSSGYDRYPMLFPLARSSERRILFLAGPTNSGKTHEALRIAAEAPSAEVLSPLRLLAMEHREALSRAGVPTGFVTGEERDVDETYTHYARTIETMDAGRPVAVTVIDEIQMLADRQRGWAWTQALVGAPSSLVVLTGSTDAIPLVERIAGILSEPLEVRRFERKNTLETIPEPLGLGDLAPGDAVVAFSRSAVHELRERISRTGLSVAAIYGALGPEVRRSEAARFRSGTADVVVATDAIGMGLNLPVSRVILAATAKYDGTGRRALTHGEILQIAGRAGRYGLQDRGFVGTMSGGRPGIERIRRALADPLPPLKGKAYVRPNRESVALAAEHLRSDSLEEVLRYLSQRLVHGHPDLRIADMDDEIVKAAKLDRVRLPILDRLVYSQTPIPLNQPGSLTALVHWGEDHAAGRSISLPRPNGRELQRLEDCASLSTAWLWLSNRFPDAYDRADEVRHRLAAVNADIERRLASGARDGGSRLRRGGPRPDRGTA